MKVFYNQDGIIVRHSMKADVEYLKDHLRQSDVDEVLASNDLTAKEALRKSVNQSLISLTILNGNPIGVFGISTKNLIGSKATIWLLGTNDLKKIKIRFLRHNKRFIKMFLEYYPYLENWVSIENTSSILWLKYLKAKIDKPQPYGVHNKFFHHFYFVRGC